MDLITPTPRTRTYSSAGWARKVEHEQITDELCDLAMDLNKLAYRVAFKKVGKRSTRMADAALEDITKIITKLQAWEDVNL